MSFFSRWDYQHYSIVHAEIEGECYEKLVQLMENEGLPNTPQQHKETETTEVVAKFSRLNKQEHKTYLRLLHTYNNKVVANPSIEQRKDIETLACLQRKVVEEQKEFAEVFGSLPGVQERYKTISLPACRFVQEHLEANLQRTLSYPRHYKEKEVFHFTDSAAIPKFGANVLQMGKFARVVRPQLTSNCNVPLDYEKLVKRFPPLDISSDSDLHPSFRPPSKDDVGIKLALTHQTSVLIELETLAVLLDSHTTGCQWELPVVVRKDKVTGKRVACIDAAILPEHLSQRERNQLCYDYAARIRLTHVNIGRGKKDSVVADPATPKRPRGRPRKTEQPRKEVPAAAVDDLFGDVEDLETFGVGKEPSASPRRVVEMHRGKGASAAEKEGLRRGRVAEAESASRLSTEKTHSGEITPCGSGSCSESTPEDRSLVTDAKSPSQNAVHGIVESTPIEVLPCARGMMTRSLTQQCLDTAGKSSDRPVLDPPSTDDGSVDSEAPPLVIDENPVEESVILDLPCTVDNNGFSPADEKNIDTANKQVAQPANDSCISDDDDDGGLAIDLVEGGGGGAGETLSDDDGTEAMLEKVVELDTPESPPPCDDVGKGATCIEVEVTASSPDSSAEPCPGVVWDENEGRGADGSLPDGENVFYNLWELGSLRLLLRHHAHAFTATKRQTWTVFPKLEYNSHFGAEMYTEVELIKQMCYLIMIPNSSLLRVRVDALSSGILLLEDLSCTQFVSVVKTFSPDKLFGRVALILEKVSALDPGHYILSCRAPENCVRLLKATDGNRRGTFDLHCIANQRAVSLESPDGPSTVVPLDPEVVLPCALRQGQIPVTFPPKDPKRPVLLIPRQPLKRFKGGKAQELIRFVKGSGEK